jgi:hypothetical protein
VAAKMQDQKSDPQLVAAIDFSLENLNGLRVKGSIRRRQVREIRHVYEDLISRIGELFSKDPDFKRIEYRRIPPPRAACEDLKRTTACQILCPVEALIDLP